MMCLENDFGARVRGIWSPTPSRHQTLSREYRGELKHAQMFSLEDIFRKYVATKEHKLLDVLIESWSWFKLIESSLICSSFLFE